jgi:hypothetical protein
MHALVAIDCEPDDMLALAVLARRGVTLHGVVVGEGCVSAKVSRTQAFLAALGLPAVQVLPGVPSSKLFPGETADGDNPAFFTDAFLDALESCGATPLLICMKPPREILAALDAQPDRARSVFGRSTLAAYGSFNFRCLGYSKTVPLVAADTTPFARVLYYESHGNAVPNLNPESVPELPTWLSTSAASAELWATCATWDADIVRDCDESCAEEEAEEARTGATEHSDRWHRNDKCRRAVRAHQSRQFVPADPVLAVLVDNPAFPVQSMTITHSGNDKEYPVITRTTEATKTFTWKNLDGRAVIAELNALLLH